MILTTRSLILRDFTAEDWRPVLGYQSDPHYLRYYEWAGRTEAEVQAFVQRFLDWQAEEPRLKFQLAVTLAGDGRLIGTCGVRLERAAAQVGELGYELAPTFWGLGYATEAAREMVRFGFEELGLHRIWGDTVAANDASRRVMEKLGMCCEGQLRENKRFKGRWWDTVIYGILAREWQQAREKEATMLSQEVDQEQIVGALPGVIEQLIAALEAGQTFDEAIKKVAATPDNAFQLAEAFGAMMAEVQEGVPRREAIQNMAARLDVPEVTALIEGLVEADEEGAAIIEVLRARLT
jgi:RimJ/RimL family protein N-acetyltransferase